MEQEILNRLDALAEKLGVATEHLWGVLVHQQVVEAWVAIVLWPLSALALVLAVAACARWFDRLSAYVDIWVFLGALILAISFLAVTASVISVVPTGFLNPEFGALEDLSRMLP